MVHPEGKGRSQNQVNVNMTDGGEIDVYLKRKMKCSWQANNM
jgi:hypothetical protein